MVSYRSGRHPLLSAPIEVHAFGWTSDTLRLQKCGWEFSVRYSPHSMTYDLALRHKSRHMSAISFGNRIDDYHMSSMTPYESNPHNYRVPPIELNAWGEQLNIAIPHEHRIRGTRFGAVDMRPTRADDYEWHKAQQFASSQPSSIPLDVFAVFRPVEDENLDKPKELLIEERSIGELMGIIKERYASSDQEYYERKVDDEGNKIITDQREIKRHLQLVSCK